MRTRLVPVLLTALGLCSCALAPESYDDFDTQYVAPVVGHQQYVTPLPQASSFKGSMWDVRRYYDIDGGGDSQIPRMFAAPQPPFSY